LNEHRQRLIDHLEGRSALGNRPEIAAIVTLSRAADALLARAASLEQEGGVDPVATALEQELRDRETLAGCIEMIIARRDGLSDRQRYLACVAALGTRPISVLASSLRGELVTPKLRSRIEREITGLGIDHVPLRFTEQSASGKSFFEMALASVGRAKKSAVLSEGSSARSPLPVFWPMRMSARAKAPSSSMIPSPASIISVSAA
jgi:hypothetical protein